ncbi:hypothetical protein [Kitasatospora sp. A2-31]|uniref:hypothetical protein n=1 Tax=Kitasatospora sp. A2-31 TaxID=2916414 RepID=UPI001EED2B51|nr:hypothetical protein [Kitasatospora sp. A2-31]MCG6499433.1 hypothetical protein [Kitasatospora sp. A2-31]
MSTQPQPDAPLDLNAIQADADLIDLIQAEADNDPLIFRANYDLHAVRLLPIAHRLLDRVRELEAEVERLSVERDQFADRVDALTAVCKSNQQAYRGAVEDCQRLAAENDELRRQLAERPNWPAHFGTPHASIGDAVGHAMAHNARLAATVRNAQDGPQRPA